MYESEAGQKLSSSQCLIVIIMTQWLSGLYYADFISFYSPTQLCGGGQRNRILTNYRFLSHSHSSLSFSKVFQRFLKDRWHFCCKFQSLSCARVGKAKCPCMKKLSFPFECLLRTISWISSHWMADIGHVHPNLVGATGLQLQLYQACNFQSVPRLENGSLQVFL